MKCMLVQMTILKSKEAKILKTCGYQISPKGFKHHFLVGHHSCVDIFPKKDSIYDIQMSY